MNDHGKDVLWALLISGACAAFVALSSWLFANWFAAIAARLNNPF